MITYLDIPYQATEKNGCEKLVFKLKYLKLNMIFFT